MIDVDANVDITSRRHRSVVDPHQVRQHAYRIALATPGIHYRRFSTYIPRTAHAQNSSSSSSVAHNTSDVNNLWHLFIAWRPYEVLELIPCSHDVARPPQTSRYGWCLFTSQWATAVTGNVAGAEAQFLISSPVERRAHDRAMFLSIFFILCGNLSLISS